jgi:hypothetical protein
VQENYKPDPDDTPLSEDARYMPKFKGCFEFNLMATVISNSINRTA